MVAGPDDPTVSVVVVNWNSGQHLRGLLDGLRHNPPRTPVEIVVVDNDSHDGSADGAEADDKTGGREVRVIRLRRNAGLAAGNNLGITSSSAPFILICNPDVELAGGAIDEMVAAMGRHPRAAWVVPRLEGPDGRPQTSAGDLPCLTEALAGRRAARFLARRRRRDRSGSHHPHRQGSWWHDWAHDEEAPIGRGAEAAYLVRREAIADIGLQDERFRLDWEGVEWSARAHSAGWEIWFDPAATVVHVGGASVTQVPYRWVIQSHRGMYLYFAARISPLWRLPLAVAVSGRAAAKLIGVAIGRPLYERAHSVARPQPAP